MKVAAYHKIVSEYLGLVYTTYDRGSAAEINENEFAQISVLTNIPKGAVVKDIIAYFIQDTDESFPDITVQKLEIEEAEELKNIAAEKRNKPIEVQKEINVGVIRWDAYFKTGGEEKSVSNQVARALSPSKYHFMAPFFSKVKDGKIEFPEADNRRFEQEAQLAIKAGINFFAYCWYQNDDPMSYARKQHACSPLGDKIKMCAIIGVNPMDDATVSSLIEDMKRDCYFKLDSRPVVFAYDAFRTEVLYIERIRNAAADEGMEIYFVGMATEANPFIVNSLLEKGMDAIGGYSVGAIEKGEEYCKLARRAEKNNEGKYIYHDKIDVVPSITCGRDTRPRIETPVSWSGDYGGNYTQEPKENEIYEHAANVLKQLSDEGRNRPKTVLIYAWNEHDEGGWCCPTLAVDEQGEPIEDIKGQPLMNCRNLNAIARAVSSLQKKQ